MLNEKVDFQFLYPFIVFVGVMFLVVMGTGFLYFSRLKKRDEEKRSQFKEKLDTAD